MAKYKDGKVVILGNEFVEKPKSNIKSKFSMLHPFMMMASFDPSYKKPRQRPEVNIILEYELIQQKKSKLSRSDRNWVVSEFNKHFIKIG